MTRVAVVGAGPTGLEAALAAHRRGWPVTVYESASHVGGHVRRWGHVRLFTPWSMDVSACTAALVGLLRPATCPTGAEFAGHLDGVAALLPNVRLGHRVDAVARQGLLKPQEIGTAARAGQPFLLLVTRADGTEALETADVVLDCTGTYGNPNPIGDGGIPALGERALADRLVREIPLVDSTWAGRRVLLVGAGNSAQTAARDLATAGAELHWVVRREEPTWGAVQDDPLPARAALVASSRALADAGVVRTSTTVQALRAQGEGVSVTLRQADGRLALVEVDVVVALTGSVGDSRLFRQLQVHQCYATEGPMALAGSLLDSPSSDCLTQTSGGVGLLRNPEPGFFILGSKSYGRNNTFLLRVGWQQVEEVFAALDAEQPAVA